MIKITEETSKELLQEWREEMKEMTLEKLPEFLRKLSEDYEHDYGTICHAISIGGVATMWAMNNTKQGGITGFQAGAIMWENIMNWDETMRNKSLKMVDYSLMLYPQYKYKFEKTISADTWVNLQKEAKENLKNSPNASENVKAHWQSIVSGNVPFGYTIQT